MPNLVRRSNLMVPVTVDRYVQGAWRYDADAVTLDLEDGVPGLKKSRARALVQDGINTASSGGAEVFVRVNGPYLEADLEASVHPGLAGVMLPKVEEAGDVARAAELLDGLERRRGLEVGVP